MWNYTYRNKLSLLVTSYGLHVHSWLLQNSSRPGEIYRSSEACVFRRIYITWSCVTNDALPSRQRNVPCRWSLRRDGPSAVLPSPCRLQSERFKETIGVYAERRLVVLQRLLRLYDFELFYEQWSWFVEVETIEGSKRGVIYHKCCMLYEIKKKFQQWRRPILCKYGMRRCYLYRSTEHG